MLHNVLSEILPVLVIAPVIIAVFVYAFAANRNVRFIAMSAQALLTALSFILIVAVREGDISTNVGRYEEFLGITLRVDTLSAVFVLLTATIFLAVLAYSLSIPYNSENRLFLFLVFILESVLIGIFLTRDFFNTFVLIEVSTVIVTLLLMFDRDRRKPLAGLKFIMINVIVMQFYLFGIGYIYMLTGLLDMEGVRVSLEALDRELLALPYALIMTGVAAKCALLPLFSWIPKISSMTGSRSTINAIISALQIKSGVYLLIRLQDVFGGIGSEFFLTIGIITAFVGIILALAQSDIRLILAYSTMAQVGLIVAGLNLGTEYGALGAKFHIVNHAVFKAALFFCVGQIYLVYNTFNIHEIRGMMKAKRPLFIAVGIAVLGIIGAPFFNGSISKYFLASGTSGFLEWIFIAINLGTIMIFVRYSMMFFGNPLKEPKKINFDKYRLGVIFALGALCVLMGVFGVGTIAFLFNETVALDVWGYAQKTLIFVISVGIALLAYKFVMSKENFLRPLNSFNLSFQKITVSLGVFFAMLLIYIGFM